MGINHDSTTTVCSHFLLSFFNARCFYFYAPFIFFSSRFYRKSPNGKQSMLLFRSSGSFSNPIVEPESGYEMDVKSEKEEDEEVKKDLAEAEGNEYTVEPEKTFST